MIKKTMAITSLAILVATISVATTITMVQADPDGDTKATFGLGLGVANPLVFFDLSDHFYSDVATSDPGTVANTPVGSIAIGNFDAAEPIFQSGGGPVPVAPIPGSPFTLYIPTIVAVTTPFNAAIGHEEATFTFTAPNPGQNYFLGTTIHDMDDFGLTFDLAGTMPATETVFVSVNGVNLITPVAAVPGSGLDQTITTAHGVVQALPAGGLVVGFNEIFTWDPVGVPAGILPVCGNIGTPIPCIGSQTGIRVEQITVLQASQSQGYWKNHPTVVDALPDVDLYGPYGDWLVDADVGDEVVFDGGKKNNAYNKLAIQLLAALLNVENGSTCTAPVVAIDDAQKLLFDVTWTTPDSVPKPSKTASPTNAEINAIKDTLDDYNNNIGC